MKGTCTARPRYWLLCPRSALHKLFLPIRGKLIQNTEPRIQRYSKSWNLQDYFYILNNIYAGYTFMVVVGRGGGGG